MKKLILLSLFLISGLAQAQTIPEAFQQGKVVNVVWNKQWQDVLKTAPHAVIISFEKNDKAAQKAKEKIAAVASHTANQMLFATIDLEATTKAGSTAGEMFNQNEEEIEMYLISGENMIVAEFPAKASVEEIQEALLAIFTEMDAQGSEGSVTEPSAPATPSGNTGSNINTGAVSSQEQIQSESQVIRVQTDEELDALLANSKNVPVIVDFSGEGWCGVCMKLHPVYEEVAKRFNGKVKFVLVDIQKNHTTPPNAGKLATTEYVPELQVFTNGKESGKVIKTTLDTEQLTASISKVTGVKP